MYQKDRRTTRLHTSMTVTTETEHLLGILAEECNEVAVRVSKAIRFGLSEIQPKQHLTNAERMRDEMIDVLTMWDMLVERGAVREIDPQSKEYIEKSGRKIEAVQRFMQFSESLGTLERQQ